MIIEKQNQIIFSNDRGDISIQVRLDQDTVWLTLNQLSQLFERDKSVISRHIKNIFKEEELPQSSVVANFATTGTDGKNYQVEYYNLDLVISLGYRVNSKRGVQFRQWANKILKEYLIQGYSLNSLRINEKGITEIQRSIELLAHTLKNQSLISTVGYQVIEIIHQYARTWNLLLAYDEDKLIIPTKEVDSESPKLDYNNIVKAITELKEILISKKEASELFGRAREKQQLEAIFEAVHQTFAAQLLYPSYQERAAHLLYFVIKDHPFVDGNKRIGSFLFLLYLKS